MNLLTPLLCTCLLLSTLVYSDMQKMHTRQVKTSPTLCGQSLPSLQSQGKGYGQSDGFGGRNANSYEENGLQVHYYLSQSSTFELINNHENKAGFVSFQLIFDDTVYNTNLNYSKKCQWTRYSKGHKLLTINTQLYE
jgi:hypothetical protein